jgi:hypothetical protein
MADAKKGQRLIYVGNMLVLFGSGMVVSEMVPNQNAKFGILVLGAILVFIGQFIGLDI